MPLNFKKKSKWFFCVTNFFFQFSEFASKRYIFFLFKKMRSAVLCFDGTEGSTVLINAMATCSRIATLKWEPFDQVVWQETAKEEEKVTCIGSLFLNDAAAACSACGQNHFFRQFWSNYNSLIKPLFTDAMHIAAGEVRECLNCRRVPLGGGAAEDVNSISLPQVRFFKWRPDDRLLLPLFDNVLCKQSGGIILIHRDAKERAATSLHTHYSGVNIPHLQAPEKTLLVQNSTGTVIDADTARQFIGCAFDWCRRQKKIEQMALERGIPVLWLQYNDICNAPEKVFRQLFDFMLGADCGADRQRDIAACLQETTRGSTRRVHTKTWQSYFSNPELLESLYAETYVAC